MCWTSMGGLRNQGGQRAVEDLGSMKVILLKLIFRKINLKTDEKGLK